MIARVDARARGSATVSLAREEDIGAIEAACVEERTPLAREQLERYLAEQGAGLRLFLVARVGDAVAGYLTLNWAADYPPFHQQGIPEIHDLFVLPSLRRRGAATKLLESAEEHASRRSDHLGLGVGLYAAYGPAHRLYARCGYLPDGTGATAGGRALHGGETLQVDDTLVLHLLKPL